MPSQNVGDIVNKKERGNPSHNCRNIKYKGLGTITRISVGQGDLGSLKWQILTTLGKKRQDTAQNSILVVNYTNFP